MHASALALSHIQIRIDTYFSHLIQFFPRDEFATFPKYSGETWNSYDIGSFTDFFHDTGCIAVYAATNPNTARKALN